MKLQFPLLRVLKLILCLTLLMGAIVGQPLDTGHSSTDKDGKTETDKGGKGDKGTDKPGKEGGKSSQGDSKTAPA